MVRFALSVNYNAELQRFIKKVLHICYCYKILVIEGVIRNFLHRKKRFTSFPSPAGMSLTKLPLGRINLPFLFSPSGPLRSFPSVWIALEAGSRAGRRE
jgi:hypothetical protein